MFKKFIIALSCLLFSLLFAGCDMFSFEIVDDSTNSSNIYGELPTAKATEKGTTPTQKDNSVAKVHFIDVGQADSIFLEFSGKTMLIDGGNKDDGTLVVDYIKKCGYSNLDYMIATHPHEDHIGGLPDVLSSFKTKEVYLPKTKAGTQIYKSFEKGIKKNGAKKIVAKKDLEIYKDSKTTVTIISDENAVDTTDLNDSSVVIKFTYGSNSFMFTGDAGTAVEDNILKRYPSDFLNVDVLKVGHHGSKTSSSEKWLKTLSPKYSVIMCETNNKYGHPHKQTLNKLNKIKTKVLRTDLAGTIVFETNGESIKYLQAK